MILVNGSEGIGTGYSTNIPCYNPKDIISNLKKLIKDPESDLDEMTPWYSGFKGTINKESDHKYITTGVFTRVNATTIEVTELPIGKWTQTYKEFLDSLLESNEIIDYKNNSDDLTISFKVFMQKTVIDELINKDELAKKLKLNSTINTSNMHMFDHECKIIKVSSAEEVIYRFHKIRQAHFVKRKKYIIERLESDIRILNSKVKFIEYVISEKVVIFKQKESFITEQISKYPELIQLNGSWNYLLDMKVLSFSAEKIESLKKELNKLTTNLGIITKKSIQEIWESELNSMNV